MRGGERFAVRGRGYSEVGSARGWWRTDALTSHTTLAADVRDSDKPFCTWHTGTVTRTTQNTIHEV